MPLERINWDKQDVVKCDERGRATLGSEFADQQVFVWVAETPDFEDDRPATGAEKDVLTDMIGWANDKGIDWYDLRPETGIVIDKQGEEYESPHQLDEAGA